MNCLLVRGLKKFLNKTYRTQGPKKNISDFITFFNLIFDVNEFLYEHINNNILNILDIQTI